MIHGFLAVLLAALSFDQIFAPAPPWGAQPERIVWAPSGTSFLYVEPTQDASEPLAVSQYDLKTRESRVLLDPSRYAGKPQTPSRVMWSPDGDSVAFMLHGSLYIHNMATGLDRLVAQDASDAQWSPLGTAIAYTHHANLYVAQLQAKLRTVQLTGDGLPDSIMNGDLDWVYPEELGTGHGFAWSPSGKNIAYLRMDERAVTNFPIADFLNPDNAVTYQRYPLAGERNPRVSLHVVDVDSRRAREVYDAGAQDEYLPFFGWKPGEDVLVAELLDRAQQHLRVVSWASAKSDASTLYEQDSDTWLDVIPLPVWLKTGASLWLLDRENSKGVYLRDAHGELRRLTGAHHTFEILGADERAGMVYISAAYPTRRDRSLLAVPLDGSRRRSLTPAEGSHTISLAPSFDSFVDQYSTLTDPPQTDLRTIAGTSVATMSARSESLRSELLPVAMLEVNSPYGLLDAYMIRPANFSPERKYPVIVYVYGGPEAPVTGNSFGRMRGLYHQMLARAGFIVFSVDGPASQLGDSAHARMLFHNLGPASLLGQEIGARYLRSLPYVDGARIGIWGWSFGGYETTYALTHSLSFRAGAAGAPVTDWRLYDSIYTERYMGTPAAQGDAYDASSVLNSAAQLHGPLLISHGTSDDNVHMANSVSLLQSLAAARQTKIDFFPYPGQRHGFTDLADLRHLYERMMQWWQAHL